LPSPSWTVQSEIRAPPLVAPGLAVDQAAPPREQLLHERWQVLFDLAGDLDLELRTGAVDLDDHIFLAGCLGPPAEEIRVSDQREEALDVLGEVMSNRALVHRLSTLHRGVSAA
jgi:hypothetical protein